MMANRRGNVNDDSMAQTMMEAYTTAVIRDATLKRYNTLAERFVILVKFFKIVFDKTFLEMAVFRSLTSAKSRHSVRTR